MLLYTQETNDQVIDFPKSPRQILPKPDLPVIDEYIDLSPEEQLCPKCGKPYISNGTEDSEIVEVRKASPMVYKNFLFYSILEEWAFMWTEMIGKLYHINNKRCEHFDKKTSHSMAV